MFKRISFFLLALVIFSIITKTSFAALSGTIKWQFPIAGASGCYHPTVGHDGTIYVPSGSQLLAISPDGIMKWSFDIGTNDMNIGTYVNTPSVDANDNIYFQSQPNGIYALDKNKNVLWNYNPTGNWP